MLRDEIRPFSFFVFGGGLCSLWKSLPFLISFCSNVTIGNISAAGKKFPGRRLLDQTLLMVLAWGMLCGCASRVGLVGKVPTPNGSAEVVRFRLSYSNVYLIKSTPPILVDAGSPGELEVLLDCLKSQGVTPQHLGGVILMHGHADHAGLAGDLQKQGAKIILGAGDVPMAKAGHNDQLNPTSLTARVIKLFADFPMKPFTPDVVISSRMSMRAWGLDAEIYPLPGHTPGSLGLIFSDQQAFVGDLMAGGMMNGLFFLENPGEHYFQPDIRIAHRNIHDLVQSGVRKFYLGHGGPIQTEKLKGSTLLQFE